MKVGIAIDDWKLSIFARMLKEAGYTFANVGSLTSDTLLLKVETDNPDPLAGVIKAANEEAARVGRPQAPKPH